MSFLENPCTYFDNSRLCIESMILTDVTLSLKMKAAHPAETSPCGVTIQETNM